MRSNFSETDYIKLFTTSKSRNQTPIKYKLKNNKTEETKSLFDYTKTFESEAQGTSIRKRWQPTSITLTSSSWDQNGP